MKIRVLLADDHHVVREGIKSILHNQCDNIEVIAEAVNGREVIEYAARYRVDVFVIDISMPELNGIETIEKLLKEDRRRKIIVLSMYNDKILVERALKYGARGYILKDDSVNEIVNAVNEVYRGKCYISPGVAGYTTGVFLLGKDRKISRSPESELTSRQKEILKLICEGYTERDIANKLNLSHHTVHVHKNNIMKALDLHNKADLIKYSIKWGIIQV
ncbi:MAG: DNA-binding response regulator [Spirochaetes bacterium]|nr:MAG: DNA-binding response regulator [Spirochaetota bacterium]